MEPRAKNIDEQIPRTDQLTSITPSGVTTDLVVAQAA